MIELLLFAATLESKGGGFRRLIQPVAMFTPAAHLVGWIMFALLIGFFIWIVSGKREF